VPELRTEITEIVTGLGMTGLASLDEGLAARPAVIKNVSAAHWDRLDAARSAGTHAAEFAAAWDNGRAFLASPDGLRGRLPALVEWKGAQQPPGFELIPADLRVDHVYLVSCKYQSQILSNSSPSNLFDRRLADRSAGPGTDSWYQTCAPAEYGHFYGAVRRHIGQSLLPPSPNGLVPAHVDRIRMACHGQWPVPLVPHWVEFSFAVATASAARWSAQLLTRARQEEMLWRLLRLSPAPYFILGASAVGHMRLRIGTPWDWRQSFKLKEFTLRPTAAGQLRVAWAATVERTSHGGEEHQVKGHVEIRWAHGRFSSVEAKIYLDTPHAEVPGYFPLAAP
jgi:hypothetical protein